MVHERVRPQSLSMRVLLLRIAQLSNARHLTDIPRGARADLPVTTVAGVMRVEAQRRCRQARPAADMGLGRLAGLAELL